MGHIAHAGKIGQVAHHREQVAAWAARINRKVTFRVLVANAVGAVAVFVYLSLIAVGSTQLRSVGDAISAVITVVYVGIVFPLAAIRARTATARMREWMESERTPSAAERSMALRLPGSLAAQFFAYWTGAAVLFGAVNAFLLEAPWGRTLQVTVTIILGGLISASLSYLLVERLNRPVFARVLADAPLQRPFTVGVRVRLLLAWALGSAAIFLLIILSPLGGKPGDHPDITIPAIFLAVTGLWAGAALTINAARSIADPLEAVRDGLQKVREGDIDVEVTVDDGGDLGMLQSGFNQMVSGLRERRRLEDLFGRHVGAEVAQQALERGVGLGGETRAISAMFVDIKRSTAMAQERPPDEVVATLNALFNAVFRAATAEGGWVNKFEGDAALCVFGAPGDQPDHATRALRAARALRRELRTLAGAYPGLDAGIGVSSGEAVAGNVGAEERYEYTVIGDPVNEAARLTEEAKSHEGRLLASGGSIAAADTGEPAMWVKVGEIQLRGRAAPTAVHEPREDA